MFKVVPAMAVGGCDTPWKERGLIYECLLCQSTPILILESLSSSVTIVLVSSVSVLRRYHFPTLIALYLGFQYARATIYDTCPGGLRKRFWQFRAADFRLLRITLTTYFSAAKPFYWRGYCPLMDPTWTQWSLWFRKVRVGGTDTNNWKGPDLSV
jgi:hypothetical protein